MARDPVCGMTVDPAKAAAHFEHHGETYFFCARGCAQKFSADPERYLNLSPAAAPSSAIATLASIRPAAPRAPAPGQQTRYTCPMHPEIVQLGPRSGPERGRELERTDIVDDATPDAGFVS